MRVLLFFALCGFHLVSSAEDASEPSQDSSTTNSSESPSPEDSDRKNWIDHTHNWLYEKGHGSVVWVDDKFVPEGQEPLKVPPSRFRLGLYGDFDFGAADSFELQPVIDLGTDIKFPNLERRLRLFVTTRDPSALPGESTTDSNNDLRVGSARAMLPTAGESADGSREMPCRP